ncbi:cell death activator CIDE-3-like [Protopterus annectens]|uniref:cell death activator CIDE-3-like n=1 Tax=Protopterus annectens TaxID=7888 RepID=UPI001CF96F7F|nr:cell death activator CIDE-3-like [Protopterus annectens]XP_043933578.1 cell death activator CIDE-3-like [Protopterus annectens]
MEYAVNSLRVLSSKSISRCVTASASVTQHFLHGTSMKPRPFRVCNWDQSLKKGIMGATLEDLLEKVQDSLLVTSPITLVLAEDGTVVDTEDFFQTLDENTVFMVLEKGQKWKPPRDGSYQLYLHSATKPRTMDVARITFDLYKTNPRDFIGCLNVKATLYGMYSVSYELKCNGAKRFVKEAARWTLFTMQAMGHALLGTSYYMQQLLDEEESSDTSAKCQRDFLPDFAAIGSGRAI